MFLQPKTCHKVTQLQSDGKYNLWRTQRGNWELVKPQIREKGDHPMEFSEDATRVHSKRLRANQKKLHSSAHAGRAGDDLSQTLVPTMEWCVCHSELGVCLETMSQHGSRGISCEMTEKSSVIILRVLPLSRMKVKGRDEKVREK
jgi:hypothetical protein